MNRFKTNCTEGQIELQHISCLIFQKVTASDKHGVGMRDRPRTDLSQAVRSFVTV